LLEAVEAFTQLDNQAVPITIVASETGRHRHIESGLKVSLLDIDGGEVVVASCGNGQYEPDGADRDHCGEDAIEVNSISLSVAIGDQATFELFDRAVLSCA
jgi:hypothetical protein